MASRSCSVSSSPTLLATDLTAPLRAIARAVERVSAGDLTTPIEVAGDDELARLAESHNRLAADLERRNRELGRILVAIEDTLAARRPRAAHARRAAHDARNAFGIIDAGILLGDPTSVAERGRRPRRAAARPRGAARRAASAGRHRRPPARHAALGARPTRTCSSCSRSRSPSRCATPSCSRGSRPRTSSSASSTPPRTTSSAAFATTCRRRSTASAPTPTSSARGARPRLGIITEQVDRLSRMVRQLLTVTRLESGALRPSSDVLALGSAGAARVGGARAATPRSSSTMRSAGWLAIADADQLDQVLWALLDNALKYGRGRRSRCVAPDAEGPRLALTIARRRAGRERGRPSATVHALRARRSAERRGQRASASTSRASCAGRWAAT